MFGNRELKLHVMVSYLASLFVPGWRIHQILQIYGQWSDTRLLWTSRALHFSKLSMVIVVGSSDICVPWWLLNDTNTSWKLTSRFQYQFNSLVLFLRTKDLRGFRKPWTPEPDRTRVPGDARVYIWTPCLGSSRDLGTVFFLQVRRPWVWPGVSARIPRNILK